MANKSTITEAEILKRIIKTIAYNFDLADVLGKIIDIVSDVTHADSCNIYLYDADQRELILTASKIAHALTAGQIRMKVSEGLTGWAAQKNEPVIIDSGALQDKRFKHIPGFEEDSYESFFAAPIVYQGNLHGVFNVQHKSPHVFTEKEVELLTTIADLVGGAITNARLIAESQLSEKQIKSISHISQLISSNKYLDEILYLITTITAEMMNSTICSIMLLDKQGKTLKISATQSLSEAYKSKPDIKAHEGISGRVIKTRQPVVIRDVREDPDYMFPDIAKNEELCSMISVPMLIKDRIVGVINVYTKTVYDFTKKDIHIMQAVAHQAAIAIENTKLIEEAEKTREALETRKLIERAKGILMNENKLSEEEAFKIIHRKAMDTRRAMKEIAEAIILAKEIRDVNKQ